MSKNTGTSELINYFDLGVNGDVGIGGNLTLDTIANAVVDTDKFLVSDNGIIKYRTGAELLSDIGAAGSFVTLATAQTITGQKTFTTEIIGTSASFTNSGSNRDLIVTHTSGSGVAVDISKFGDGEGLRVSKYSGSGNAVTITGGLLSAEAASFSGNIAANGGLTLAAAGTADSTILRNTSGTTSSTTGSNVIGFNGVNNIFVSTQNRGGFILGFNNSVQNREYTLPDASGTIALTSSIPANPIGGTGTTNYLPKFTGASTIGNSIVSESGSNISVAGSLISGGSNKFVKIGNTAGIFTNSTYFNDLISLDATVLLSREDGLYTGAIFTYESVAADNVGIVSNGSIRMVVNGTANRGLILDRSGNLLVGTTTDNGAKLQVSGTIRASASGNTSIISESSDNYPLFQLIDNRVGGTVWNIEGGRTIGNLQFRSNVAGGTVLEIAASGAATFSSSVTAGGDIQGGGDLYFNRPIRTTIYPTTTNQNLHIKSNGSGTLQFNDDVIGNISMVVGGGKVGIGNDSPSSILSIGPNSNITQSINISGTRTQLIYDTTLGTAGAAVLKGGNKEVIIDTSGSKYIALLGGNVLIGTTTDGGYKLNVNGTTQLADNVQINNGVGGTSPKIAFGTETPSAQGFKGIYLESYWMYMQVHYNEGLRIRAVNGVGGSQTIATFSGASGNLSILGALSKGSGSFKIDHPLPEKKDTHHLVHSFIEGPQADNIYRGKINLVNGYAEVNIDEASGMTQGTFVLLNGNVQCFTSNESGWTAIKGRIDYNILKIESEDSNCNDTVSWMVIGERHDQHMKDTDWTDKNGKVIVEPLKK